MNMTHSIIFRRVIVAVAPAIIVGCTIAPLPDIDTKVTENPDYKIIRALGMSTESIVETEDTYIVEGDIVWKKVLCRII
jgi:hypothetical protein